MDCSLKEKGLDNMNTTDKIKEKLEKEKIVLAEQEAKKDKIEAKIRCHIKNIKEYEMMLNQHRLSEADSVITATGLTLEEIMNAIKSGDLLSLQEKIEKEK